MSYCWYHGASYCEQCDIETLKDNKLDLELRLAEYEFKCRQMLYVLRSFAAIASNKTPDLFYHDALERAKQIVDELNEDW
jgi:hypothetical protein